MSTGHKKNYYSDQRRNTPTSGSVDSFEFGLDSVDVYSSHESSQESRFDSATRRAHSQELETLRETYDALDSALNDMVEQGASLGGSASAAYAHKTAVQSAAFRGSPQSSTESILIDEQSFGPEDFAERRRSSTGFAEINPRSISLVEQLEDFEEIAGNSTGIDGQIERASSNKASDNSKVCDEDISECSFWATVRDNEQWHIKEFYPSPLASKDAESLSADKRLSSIRDSVLSASEKSVFLLHGEFATSRSFYGKHEGKGIGLAWSLARAGYHVFVVDMVHRRVKVAESEKGGFWSRLKTIRHGAKDSELITRCLASALSACADRVFARLNDEIVNELPVCSTLLNEQHADAAQRESCIQLIDEIQLARSELEDQMHSPGIWMGHGFSSALLSACWARLPEERRTATRMVFFGARRRWRSGSVYSRVLSGFLSSASVKLLVRATGRFPSKFLQLGSADQPSEMFELFSAWSGDDQWLDPVDQFDYLNAFREVRTPPTLHVMNEFEDALVAASDVRRFANEVCPESANLIGIPSSLPQSTEQLAQAVPRFSHSGMLVSESAEDWIFNPVINWLADSALASAPFFEQLPDEDAMHVESQQFEAERGVAANLGDLIPSSSYS